MKTKKTEINIRINLQEMVIDFMDNTERFSDFFHCLYKSINDPKITDSADYYLDCLVYSLSKKGKKFFKKIAKLIEEQEKGEA